MSDGHENDPLHGMTLEAILLVLVERYGWDGLAERIPINCFSKDPSVKSSLVFLRRTPWARTKVEKLYLGKLRGPRKGGARRAGPAGKTPGAEARASRGSARDARGGRAPVPGKPRAASSRPPLHDRPKGEGRTPPARRSRGTDSGAPDTIA